ncbi:MAG TPA: hypothetical protein VK689_10665 [Armatimonadota bacterium]|nr:hypothetical protein [Armatimonadota bacterium]
MKRAVAGLVAAGLLLGGTAAWADTVLMHVTPRNIQGGTFRLKSKAARNSTVEFVIRRDVSGISEPSPRGYLSNPLVDGKSIGKPVKLEQDGKLWTFRFTVPADQVADSVFTLWGGGQVGEGVTYRFRLAQFRKPAKD